MQRIGFTIQVRPERLSEYREIHQQVWPDLLAELTSAGIRNYSLWLAADGLQFGYLECDNWEASCDYLAQSEVHSRWQEFMKDYLVLPGAERNAGQPVTMLERSFLLE